jgi:predicted transcriptional regulator
MMKTLVNWKKQYTGEDELVYNYYYLLVIGLNKMTLSEKELKVLVELNKKTYHSSELNTLAQAVGFKHQVLKNSLTKLKKYSLVSSIKSTYTLNPILKIDTRVKSFEIKCVLNGV